MNAKINSRLASPYLPGDRTVPLDRACDALEFLIEELRVPETPGNLDLLVQYVCERYRRGEIEGARRTLMGYVDLTAAYRIEAMLHAPKG